MSAARTRPRGYIAMYRPRNDTNILLGAVEEVLAEYREHWPVTIRQIYYRLVGHHGYPKTDAFYERLIHHLGNARRGRRIPFDAIRDDGVTTVPFNHYADADAFMRETRERANRFRRDLMAAQRLHVEVWCEAAGMILQLANVAERYSVPVYSSSGFDSLTAKYDLAQRICRKRKPALILHLGDYDKSGEAVFSSISEDVARFVERDRLHGLVTVEFRRVALTADQVRAHRLPTTISKGRETCQLEALAPDIIALMLDHAISRALDLDQIEQDRQQSEVERRMLTTRLLTFVPAGRNNGEART